MLYEDVFFGLPAPLDALPTAGQTRAANLVGFSSYARQKGADPRRIVERRGMEARALTDPDAHVDCQALVDVFEDCSDLFNDPLFGLHLAERQEAEVYGCITAFCRSAPDVRTAIGCLIDYMPIAHSPEAAMELVEAAGTVELRWHVQHDLGINDQANLQALMLNVKLLRAVGGGDVRLTHVDLGMDARPDDLTEIELALGCRVHNNAGRHAIGLARADLERPVPSANRLLYRLIGGYLDRVRAADHATIGDRVRAYVRGALPTGTCSIERCATKLGVSVRTLQDRLARDSETFSDVVERERMMLAKSYLARPDATLDQIAEWLGYGEQTSFGRAFKRWVGTTPRRFRAAIRR